MAHMELTGYIGGRHDNGKQFLFLVDNAAEITSLFPHIVDLLFHSMRIIHFRQFFHFDFLQFFKCALRIRGKKEP